MDEPSLSLRSSCGLVEPCCLSRSILEFHNRSDTIALALPHCHCTHTLLTLFLPGWALTEGKEDIFKVTHSNPVPLTHMRLTTATRLMRGNDTSAFFQEQHATVTGIVPRKRTSTDKERPFAVLTPVLLYPWSLCGAFTAMWKMQWEVFPCVMSLLRKRKIWNISKILATTWT